MRRPPRPARTTASMSCVLLLAIALLGLAGCGGSGSGKQAAVALTSSAIAGGEIPARYTCDGANVAPPLRWGTVPSGTVEVALFAVGLSLSHTWNSVEWAVAGVKPELHELRAGKLPPGAFLEEASNGRRDYSICPPKGRSQTYAFVIFALPPGVQATPQINGVNLYHNLAEGPSENRAPAKGELAVAYTRR
jgi:phosphatidylethanolamine-binding protein (PEBP) family uncharacterized protein